MAVKTRFAPSPTGYLHVGGIRTALFAWLVARQAGGQFLLRIEDTDKAREVSGADKHIIDSLKALDLNFDNEPYYQSKHLDTYKHWAQKLIDSGRAYVDPYSTEEVQAFREQAGKDKKPFLFRNHRPENPPKWNGKQPLRFKADPKQYKWHDVVMGDLSTGPEVVDDFILIKSDGYPTYNFAHIVDDSEMEITHVIRGQEFISSVPNYLNLYEALELKPSIMATMPHILNEQGNKKLSKRDGAKDVLDYIREGYLPDALVSFIATLGWNDGTEQEIFTRDELIEKFSLERVQKSGAHFDEHRLQWINGHLIRELELGELYERAKSYLPESAIDAAFNYKREVLRLVQERLKYFGELPELTDFLFKEDYVLDKDLLLSSSKHFGHPKEVLETVKKDLSASDFSSEDLNSRLWHLVKKLDTKPNDLFGLIRVSITGKKVAPGLWEMLHVLGKETSLKRLDRAITLL